MARSERFDFDDSAQRRTLASWAGKRDAFRAQFDASKLPVRTP